MTTPPPQVTVVPNLVCFSRGDDLAQCLARGAPPVEALRAYAALLHADADRIAAIAVALEAVPTDQAVITAEGPYIGITLPAPDADALIAANEARLEVPREEFHAREERRRW